jgi:hypothetical protein
MLQTQWPLLIVVALTGYLVRAALPQPEITTNTAGILFLLLAVAVAAAANHSRNRIQSFIKGAKGEEMAARELGMLPQEFTVFHGLDIIKLTSITKGLYDLDHVVVGPNGVFVIETKNWSDDITIENGNLLYAGQTPTRPPLEQVKTEAKQLQAHLKSEADIDIEIRPVLCFASNNLHPGEQGAVGVIVCNANRLTNVILSHDENIISDSNQMRIIKTLRKNYD